MVVLLLCSCLLGALLAVGLYCRGTPRAPTGVAEYAEEANDDHDFGVGGEVDAGVAGLLSVGPGMSTCRPSRVRVFSESQAGPGGVKQIFFMFYGSCVSVPSQ